MIEYCEVMDSKCSETKVISVQDAVDFFSYQSVSIEEDEKYYNDLNKSKEIIEDSFIEEAPEEAQEVSNLSS